MKIYMLEAYVDDVVWGNPGYPGYDTYFFSFFEETQKGLASKERRILLCQF